VFDAVFAALFDGRLDPADSRGDPNAPPTVGSEPRARPSPVDDRPAQPGQSGSSAASAGGADDGAASEREVLLAAASTEERLRRTSFADLAGEELAGVRELVRRLVLSTPVRRSRRSRASRRSGDRLDLRRTVRSAQRTGG
jgi:uncharacterized protein with von Willebrand factor type A (vWA) domain